MNPTKQLAAVLLAIGLTACTPASPQETVYLSAASSLTQSVENAIAQYESDHPHVSIVATFDSSGTLMTQISQGAECHIFLSAAQKQMDLLDIEGIGNGGLDFIQSGSRISLVENTVVLAVPPGNPGGISGFEDLTGDKFTRLCLGNSDVPVGAYALTILDALGVSISALERDGRVTYAANVREITTQLSEGLTDVGIVYATDAAWAQLPTVATATMDLCPPAIYPAALTHTATPAAQDFFQYLLSDIGLANFTQQGFGLPQ